MTTTQTKNDVKHHRNVTHIIMAGIIGLLIASGTVAAPASDAANADMPKVILSTSEGTIELLLRPDLAPETVKNFLTYVDSGFYEGTVFHRVIPGFMIQGGGFDQDLKKKPTQPSVRNEAVPTAKNLRGTIAMARTSDPDSATSQFFINLVDNDYLNAGVRGPGYTVFGKVTDGMGVADAIANQPTTAKRGMGDVPVESVVIQHIRRQDD